MTANEFRTVTDFEASLVPGKEVLVRWSAGSGGHYHGEAKVKRVNRASVRVVLTNAVACVTLNGKCVGGYQNGHEIVVPLLADSGLKTWAYFNRVEPVDGYQPVEE